MDLIHFRQHVGETLELAVKKIDKKRGRPLTSKDSPTVPKKRAAMINPIQDALYDGLNHLPEFCQQKHIKV
ncbi:hypothetical protein PR048_013607 [Dryococelus australis]|uniref:Mobile element protein n=1 Tax=Dryococelus australis TaxID=614101 RepID=A0ABQ9HT30_9NEOP|nr:hypothetical protein PR048_013607 [Dryococelus australis]